MHARRSTAMRQSQAAAPVDLILADKALNSLRASGHDYCSAVGEVFDNNLQANSNAIHRGAVGSDAETTDVTAGISN